jgi:hydroxypyruvate isomerase
MQRRHFIQNTLAASAALSVPAVLSADAVTPQIAPKFKMKYGPHDGMFAANGGDIFGQIQFAADHGFTGWEDNGMMGRSVQDQEKMGNLMAKLGISMGVFVVGFDGWPPNTTLTSGDKKWREKFLTACKEAVNVAKRCNAKFMTVVPGNFDRSLPMGIQTANVIESMRRACDIFEPHGLVIVMEPLSDTPDLFLRHSDQTYMICKAVNSPSCKILYDIYHMQRNEGQLIRNIDLCWEEIAYFQIGDNPGRNEPTTGEINYKNLFKHIASKGYTGVMGMEHGNFYPGKEGEMKLIEAYTATDLE